MHLGGVDPGSVGLEPGRPQSPYLAQGDVVEIHGFIMRPRSFVEAGEQQQGLDDALQAQPLLGHDLGELSDARHLGVRLSELGVLPDGRERGAQFVRGIRYEAPLGRGRRIEPIEHPVHRRGERGDLVPGLRNGHALVQTLGGDAVDLFADPSHRTQGSPDHEPGRDGDEQQEQGEGDRQQGRDRGEGLRVVFHGDREHERLVAVQIFRDHQHALAVDGRRPGSVVHGQRRRAELVARLLARGADGSVRSDDLQDLVLEGIDAAASAGTARALAECLETLLGRTFRGTVDARAENPVEGEGAHEQGDGDDRRRAERGPPAHRAPDPPSHRRPPAGSPRRARSRSPHVRRVCRACGGGARRRPRRCWDRRRSRRPRRPR